jgi:hypothetical protein
MARIVLVLLAALSLIVALPVSGAAEKGKVVCPFNGTDLRGWKVKGNEKNSRWVVGHALVDPKDPSRLILGDAGGLPEMVNVIPPKGHSLDIYTEQKFGDCTIEVELMIPRGSNSGVYVMGEYEIQILDSYGKKKVVPGDMGGLYGMAAPMTNACKKPGEWQKMVIDLQAPRFENGKKTANGRLLKVTLNGAVIHENVELPRATPGGVTGREAATGPLMFQGNHGPISFRNIKITIKDSK